MHRYRGIENFSTGIELVLRFDLLGFDAVWGPDSGFSSSRAPDF